LQYSKGATKYKTILSALRTAWSATKIEDLKSRLQTVRDELQFRILISIRDDQVQGLDESDRKAILSVLESNKELLKTITSQTEIIRKRQHAESSLASMRHHEVLHAVTRQKRGTYSIQDVTHKITSSLYYTRKDDRYDDIDAAHRDTFNWALEGRAKGSTSWPSLTDWLQHDGGVYWISGKAGSGKSTLMKYLYQDPRFTEALKL
jgi:type II secretory ATPase GspE/PulE/Tfp pilus assembly ATPase PilB-like protein